MYVHFILLSRQLDAGEKVDVDLELDKIFKAITSDNTEYSSIPSGRSSKINTVTGPSVIPLASTER